MPVNLVKLSGLFILDPRLVLVTDNMTSVMKADPPASLLVAICKFEDGNDDCQFAKITAETGPESVPRPGSRNPQVNI